MVMYRAEKVKRIGKMVKEPTIIGHDSGDILVISWGSTFGAVFSAVRQLQQESHNISMLHLRWLNPLPEILGHVIKNFKQVVVPELNTGQLLKLIRSEYLVDAVGINKIQGMPFTVKELYHSLSKTIGEL